jgi:hypothetical protein
VRVHGQATDHVMSDRVNRFFSSSDVLDLLLNPQNVLFSGYRVIFFPVRSDLWVKLTSDVYLASKLKTRGVIPPPLHVRSWRLEGQLCFYRLLCLPSTLLPTPFSVFIHFFLPTASAFTLFTDLWSFNVIGNSDCTLRSLWFVYFTAAVVLTGAAYVRS